MPRSPARRPRSPATPAAPLVPALDRLPALDLDAALSGAIPVQTKADETHVRVRSGGGNMIPPDQDEDAASDRTLVLETLREIMRDTAAPAAARAQAARTLAELRAYLGQHREAPHDDGKPVGRMTRAQLEAALSDLPTPPRAADRRAPGR